MNPKISIITISYNNCDGLEKTIKSVTSQSLNDFEYIVIDGGSNDGSKGIIEKYADKISYWVSEPDKGIYNAMNKGIKAANGEYLLFLNSGDHFKDNKVLKNIELYLTGEDIIYGDLEIIDEQSSWVKIYPKDLSFYHFYSDSLPHPASFIKKSAFDTTDNYDESLKIVSDWKWFLNAFTFHGLKFKSVSQIISCFYLDGISSTNTEKSILERNKVLDSIPLSIKKDAIEMVKLKEQFENLKYRHNHLIKYRVIKLLEKLEIIKIK